MSCPVRRLRSVVLAVSLLGSGPALLRAQDADLIVLDKPAGLLSVPLDQRDAQGKSLSPAGGKGTITRTGLAG